LGATITSDISPLIYNYISSDRFFNYFFEEFIPQEPRITHIQKWVNKIQEGHELQSIECEDGTIFYAKKIADSRPIKNEDTYPIYQHFCGKFVEFDQPILDDLSITLMDFSLPVSTKDMAVFHYILPFSKTKALIETTVFSHLPYNREVYEDLWKKYMNTHYHSKKFQVVSDEFGTIPMSIPKQRVETNVFKIGTAGGMIKASTGYAFTRIHKDAINKANNRSIDIPKRFQFYDKMLLKIMQREMNKIPAVMDRLFEKVPKKDILCFLDDKTSLSQDIQLLSRLDIPFFIKHLLR
jgi:lycopene beta-cyclase